MRKITRMADSYDLVYERRRLERFDLQVPAKIEVLSSADMVPVTELLTKDICAGGAYFPTKLPLAAGTKVKLDILLPLRSVSAIPDNTRGLIKVNGTVIRSGPAGMAIGFRRRIPDHPIPGSHELKTNPPSFHKKSRA